MQAYQHFFFWIDPEHGLHPEQDWMVGDYLSYLRLTPRGHQYVGYDEIREWLIAQGHPYEIDGVRATRLLYRSTTVGLQTPRPLDVIGASEQKNLVLVRVADAVAAHFKLRWA